MTSRLVTRFAAVAFFVLICLAPGSDAQSSNPPVYRFFAGSDSVGTWSPDSGALDVSRSGDQQEVSGRLSDAFGLSNYAMAAAPGIVVLSQSGKYVGPSPAGFVPGVQTVLELPVTFSGPPNVHGIQVSINVRVRGRLRHACDGDCLYNYILTEFGLGFQSEIRGLSLTGSPVGGQNGLTVKDEDGVAVVFGQLISRTFGAGLPNSPRTLRLLARAAISTGVDSSWIEEMCVSLPDDGPVFNLPVGYTANGEGIVNNRWTNPIKDDHNCAPAIVLTKTPDRQIVRPGSTVTYTLEVINKSNDPLIDVVVNDPTCSPLIAPIGFFGTLGGGQTVTLTCQQILNADAETTATVIANDLDGTQVLASARASVRVSTTDPIPAVTVTKTVDQPQIMSEELVTYTIAAENVGEVPLPAFGPAMGFVDNRCGPLSPPTGDDGDSVLSPGETWTTTCSKVLAEDTTNVARWEAFVPGLGTVSDTDTAFVDVVDLAVAVTNTPDKTVVRSGQSVTHTITAKNVGVVAVEPSSQTPAGVDGFDGAGCGSFGPVTGDDGDRVLEPGETWGTTCLATVTADTTTEATWTGSAPALGFVQGRASAFVDVVDPNVAVQIAVDKALIPSGETVTYTISAENRGDVAMTPLSIAPSAVDGFSADACHPLARAAGDDGDLKLEPGETWTTTCSAILSSDTTNTAVWTGLVDGLGIVADTGTATVDVDSAPPVVLGVPDRAPNANGWYSAPVTIDWRATDDSGSASDPPDSVASTEALNLAYTSGPSCDPVGNCATGVLSLSIDLTAPALLLSGDITVDATSPAGATVVYSASASDALDPSPDIACSQASGGVFPIGKSTVSCTAVDAAGHAVSGTITVHVRDATEQIIRLIDKTLAFLDQPSLRTVIKTRLEAAVSALLANNRPAAQRALDLYISAVNGARTSALSTAEKAELIDDARRIKAVIG